MNDFVDDDSKEKSTEVFANAKSGTTVVLAFVLAYGWWHIYQQGDDGFSKNWPVTVAHKFRTKGEGRQFLLSRGWSSLHGSQP